MIDLDLGKNRGDVETCLERRFVPNTQQITAKMAICATLKNGQY
jgi:hypothetical protein